MKKIVLRLAVLTIILFSMSEASFGQVINAENFTDTIFLPTGWTSAGGPITSWSRRTVGTLPACTPLTNPAMARFASRTAPLGSRQTISSPSINYTDRGSATPSFKLWMYRDTTAGHDSLIVYINTTKTTVGATVLGVISRNIADALPNTEVASDWYNYSFDVPPSFSGATNYIMLQGVSNRGGNIFIDSIVWDSYAPMCAGTPNVGDIVQDKHLICAGTGNVNLSLTAPIDAMGITYEWSSAPSSSGPWTVFGTNTPTVNSGVITATTYFQCTVNCSMSGLTYVTNYDSCIVSSSTPPVITFVPPAPAFCTGDPGISVQVFGASSYVWSPGATLSDSTSDSVFASPLATTRYTVTATDSIGCSVTARVNVSVQNPPVITITANPLDILCAGTMGILRASGGGVGGLYAWSDGVLTRSDTIYPTASNTYHVTVSTSGGCSSEDSIFITVLPATVADFTYTSVGSTVSFTDISTDAAGSSWDFGDGGTSSSTNPIYSYASPGVYTVTLTAFGTGCGDDTISKIITIYPNAIRDINANNNLQLTVLPNPVTDRAAVSFNATENGTLNVMNLLGETLFSVPVKVGAHQTQSIDLSKYEAGIYMVQVKTNSAISTMKIVKK